jgi:hypothetical protein
MILLSPASRDAMSIHPTHIAFLAELFRDMWLSGEKVQSSFFVNHEVKP